MTDPTPDFRALCAELLQHARQTQALLTGEGLWDVDDDEGLFDRADKVLATPPPKPPTVMQILELSGEIKDAGIGHIDLVRAALERWGK